MGNAEKSSVECGRLVLGVELGAEGVVGDAVVTTLASSLLRNGRPSENGRVQQAAMSWVCRRTSPLSPSPCFADLTACPRVLRRTSCDARELVRAHSFVGLPNGQGQVQKGKDDPDAVARPDPSSRAGSSVTELKCGRMPPRPARLGFPGPVSPISQASDIRDARPWPTTAGRSCRLCSSCALFSVLYLPCSVVTPWV